jgi:glycosyltransferase involved in cell wall biosynthesis
MKILLFSNTDWFMFNFNNRLIRSLIESGHEVLVAVPDGPYVARLGEIGCRVIVAPLARKSINPVGESLFLLWLVRLLHYEKPNIVHNFTLKCVLWGSLAALATKVPVRVNELTGLGFVFTSKSLKAKFIRSIVHFLFRFALKGNSSHLLTLNVNDYNIFISLKWLYPCTVHLVLGAGVDCNRFHPSKTIPTGGFRVLLPARMLWDKGVGEFIIAARDLKSRGVDAEFLLAGNTDSGNPTAISEQQLAEWSTSGVVKWLGHISDMAELYCTVHVVVLPSYREGLPTSLTEAAAFGLPLIATNVPGCKDVVLDGVNGFLVPVMDSKALATSILKLYENRELCHRFGLVSRKLAEEKFDEQIIIKQRLAIYSDYDSLHPSEY